ncbi:MAG: Exodeoxyribonuclease VII small subunit, partial [uncultured Lysobacter sp.]
DARNARSRLVGQRFRTVARSAGATGGPHGARRHESGGVARCVRARRGPLPPLPDRAGTGGVARAHADGPAGSVDRCGVPAHGNGRARCL